MGFRVLVCAAIALASTLGVGAAPAEPLRFIANVYPGHAGDGGNRKGPGFSIEVTEQVLATMGRGVSFESFPLSRAWAMIARDERDGMPGVLRTSERERLCSFPDEPLTRERLVLFVRTADAGKLKFSSFDDLIGHDVAASQSFVSGALENPNLSPELVKFLREHHNLVETSGDAEGLRMLAAGHVDYAVMALILGMHDISETGLSGKIEPILSRDVIEEDNSVCFTKARISPSFVDDFSRALKQFKQTDAFRVIYQKYLP